MKPQYSPGSVWLHTKTQTEHHVLSIDEEGCQTISPSNASLLPESTLENAPVVSWHGSHEAFHQEFVPAVAA